jgi:hypothetical protein
MKRVFGAPEIGWRDTKTAIFVFNRGTAMSTVLAQIESETPQHRNYKRKAEWKHESGV